MSDFGDSDPEDAYDANDPPGVRFVVLLLWVASVALEQARGDHEHVRVLARIQQARYAGGVLSASTSGLNARQRFRIKALRDWLDDMLATEGP